MKMNLMAGGLVTLACASFASAAASAAGMTADRISVFKAPLVCPAAPQIGCGSASKPILLDLERQPGVLEAWLNRAGTIIAVVWKPDVNAEARGHVAADLKEDHATEMQGESRDEAVKDFLSGKPWYRGADVDRLSEEEAAIVAARFVRRIEAKTTLEKEKADALRHALADAITKRTTNDNFRPDNAGVLKLEDEVQKAGGQSLDANQRAALKEAIGAGWRPLPNEN